MRPLLILLALLTLAALMPLGIFARYDSGGSRLELVIGPFRRSLLRKRKDKRKGKMAKQQEETERLSIGGKIDEFYPIFRAILRFLRTFSRKIRVNRLILHVGFGGLEDPAGTAIRCGQAWAAIGIILPPLRNYLDIRKENVSASCDFTRGGLRMTAEVKATFRLYELVDMAFRYGFQMFRLFLSASRQKKELQILSEKAVQSHESSST